jgi:hypothetical protein
MPFVGKEFVKDVCSRHGLPYAPISGWLWKDGVLADDLQRAVETVLNTNTRKP